MTRQRQIEITERAQVLPRPLSNSALTYIQFISEIGKTTEPVLINSLSELIQEFGEPSLEGNNNTYYSAINYLKFASGLVCQRVVNKSDAKYGACLINTDSTTPDFNNVALTSTEYNAGIASANRVVKEVTNGLSDSEYDSYAFTSNDDLLLITALGEADENKSIGIGITESEDLPEDTFTLNVYYDGELAETFVNVSPSMTFTDGFNRNRYIETLVNDVSQLIRVKVNQSGTKTNSKFNLPSPTDFSTWTRIPSVNYEAHSTASTIHTASTQFSKTIRVTNSTNLATSQNIVFYNTITDEIVSREYTISAVDTLTSSSYTILTLNKEIIETSAVLSVGVQVRMKNTTLTYYPLKRLAGESSREIDFQSSTIFNDGHTYKVLDSGANRITGGESGTAPRITDFTDNIDALENSSFDITLYIDAGYNNLTYWRKLVDAAESEGDAFVYLSSTKANEELTSNSLAVTNLINEVKNSNVTSSYASFHSGWSKFYDAYNNVDIDLSPVSFAAARQSMLRRQNVPFTPAAGWNEGTVSAGKLLKVFNEKQRYELLINRVNLMNQRRTDGQISLWGNETLEQRNTPTRIRSVRMMLIYLRRYLQNYLPDALFTNLTQGQIDTHVSTISTWIDANIVQEGGAYDYRVYSTTSNDDITQRTLNLSVDIEPAVDIKLINLSLSVLNRGSIQETTVTENI